MTVILLKESPEKSEKGLRKETYAAVRSLYQGQSDFLKERVARKLRS